jgi:DNA-binding NtrC family response regulator
MPHLAPAILVFEKRPRWEAALKRILTPEAVLIRPCRSVADLLVLCRSMPESVVVIDLDAGIKPALQCLEQALLSRLGVLPLVVEAGDTRELEWTFRELGALAVLPETIRGDELAALCQRLLAE